MYSNRKRYRRMHFEHVQWRYYWEIYKIVKRLSLVVFVCILIEKDEDECIYCTYFMELLLGSLTHIFYPPARQRMLGRIQFWACAVHASHSLSTCHQSAALEPAERTKRTINKQQQQQQHHIAFPHAIRALL